MPLLPSRAAGVNSSPEIATHRMRSIILSKLREFFLSRSVPAFLVGGYVRDSLQGTPTGDLPTRDLDVAVQGDAPSLARDVADSFGGSFVPLGHSRQAGRAVVPSEDGDRWVIDVSGMDGPLHSDLLRRDFTIDAMALALDDWGIPGWEDLVHDPWGGRDDLSRGVIRAVRPSVFGEDPARLLRAVRLASKLGFRIDPHTAQTISRDAHLILSVAGERVRDEFLTILSLDRARVHLETLDELGLLCYIIPELGTAKGVEQPREHHWDVFGHSLHAVEGVERVVSPLEGDPVSSLVPWNVEMEERFAQGVSDGHTRRTILKLGALLHDVAKPQTKMVDDRGKTRFLGHHILGASMSREALHRMRLSSRGVEMVHLMVENHLRPTQMSQGGEMPTPRAVYRYFRDVGDVAIDTLYLSLGDHLAARGPDLEMEGWERHTGIIAHILEVGTREQAPERMPRIITGHDLIAEFRLTPGPLVGTLLEGAQYAQAAGEVGTREEALAWVRSRLEGPTPDCSTDDSAPKDPDG